MNFIDALVDSLLLQLKIPSQMREVLYLLILELSLKSKNLEAKKAWLMIGSLISFAGRESRFPSTQEISAIKASINSNLRERTIRTSDCLVSLRRYELGEREVKKFFTATAWQGLPGWYSDGTPWETGIGPMASNEKEFLSKEIPIYPYKKNGPILLKKDGTPFVLDEDLDETPE